MCSTSPRLDLENLIRLDPADVLSTDQRPATGFHLVDTTMMYAPRSGGVKRYLTAKSAWLDARRPDIRHTLVVPGASTRAQGHGMVTVAATLLPFADGYRMPASPTKWANVLRTLEPDIIEAGDVFVPGHAAMEAGDALGVPVIGFCHTDAPSLAALHLGDWAEQPTFNFWAQAYQRFDQVVAPSRHTASRLAEAGVERVVVQPLGVDTELFHPRRGDRGKLLARLGLSANSRLLVFAGRPAREKNVESMIDAVERLGEPYRLVLIGAGKDARYSSRGYQPRFRGRAGKPRRRHRQLRRLHPRQRERDLRPGGAGSHGRRACRWSAPTRAAWANSWTTRSASSPAASTWRVSPRPSRRCSPATSRRSSLPRAAARRRGTAGTTPSRV